MEKYQANQDYYSDTMCILVKVKSVNNTMCVGTFFDFDFDNETYIRKEDFIMSHKDLFDTLHDDYNGDDDGGISAAQIIFTPEFTFN